MEMVVKQRLSQRLCSPRHRTDEVFLLAYELLILLSNRDVDTDHILIFWFKIVSIAMVVFLSDGHR